MKPNINHITISLLLIGLCTACGGDQPKTLTQRLNSISETVKSVDSAAERFSKGASKFSKKVEKYADTTKYKKDSLGKWQKKQ